VIQGKSHPIKDFVFVPLSAISLTSRQRAVLGKSSPASCSLIEAVQLTNDHNASNLLEAVRARYRFLKNAGHLNPDDRIGE